MTALLLSAFHWLGGALAVFLLFVLALLIVVLIGWMQETWQARISRRAREWRVEDVLENRRRRDDDS
jgi:hypothetical protein